VQFGWKQLSRETPSSIIHHRAFSEPQNDLFLPRKLTKGASRNVSFSFSPLRKTNININISNMMEQRAPHPKLAKVNVLA
jgi:hypothetical protein